VPCTAGPTPSLHGRRREPRAGWSVQQLLDHRAHGVGGACRLSWSTCPARSWWPSSCSGQHAGRGSDGSRICRPTC